jgi:hypothetical protein
MAFSEGQYKNFIKVIVVAAVAKEFRKSAIIKKIVKKIKSQGIVATGELSNPQLTGSILPSRDDRFLVEKGGVVVKTAKIGPKGTPVATEIAVKIRYGLAEEKYFYLTHFSPDKKWFPSIDNIAKWIKVKKARGKSFTITKKGIKREAKKDWEIKSVAYLIARSISKNGIDKRDFLKPFEDKNTGVNASLRRAQNKITERLFELYGTTLVQVQNDVIGNIL